MSSIILIRIVLLTDNCQMMYLALTYDHRLLDGREAVQFLVKIKEYVQDPSKMLLA